MSLLLLQKFSVEHWVSIAFFIDLIVKEAYRIFSSVLSIFA